MATLPSLRLCLGRQSACPTPDERKWQEQAQKSGLRTRRLRRLSRSISRQLQKLDHVAPNARQARHQLVIVVEQRKRRMRPSRRVALDILINNGMVAPALKDPGGLRGVSRHDIVLQAGLVGGVV